MPAAPHRLGTRSAFLTHADILVAPVLIPNLPCQRIFTAPIAAGERTISAIPPAGFASIFRLLYREPDANPVGTSISPEKPVRPPDGILNVRGFTVEKLYIDKKVGPFCICCIHARTSFPLRRSL